MAAANITAEELTTSVAQHIAERLKLDSTALITKLVDSLTKSLVKTAPLGPQKDNVKIKQSNVVTKTLDSLNETPASQPSVFSKITQPYAERLNQTTEEPPSKTSREQDISKSQESVFEKQNTFLFDGFTDKGLNELKEELPSIIKEGMSDLLDASSASKSKEKDSSKAKPGGSLLKGLGILAGLAGLVTLLYGLQTDGPFKGLAKLAAKGLLSVSGFTKMFDKVAKKMVRYLIRLPLTLLNKFTEFLTPLLGKGAGSNLIKTGLTKLTGFLPKLLAGALKFLKKVPFFGSLISLGFAVSRFKNGDVVGGGIEVLSGIAGLFPGIGTGVSLALDALSAFIDMKAGGSNKQAGDKKLNFIGEFASKIGSRLKEKLIDLPIIGPAIKGITHLVNKEWLKGIKQIAYIVPGFELIGALLGDKETGAVAQTVGSGLSNVWGWTKELGSLIWEKVKNAPIIGPAIKGFQKIFQEKDFLGGLTLLAKKITDLRPMKWLIDWIVGPDTVDNAIDSSASAIKNGMNFAKELKDPMLRKILEFLPETVMGISVRSRVAKMLGIDLGEVKDEPTQSAPSDTTPKPAKNVADGVIDSEGGLVVSSPTEGSLFQLSKNDGVVAAPVTKDDSSVTTKTQIQSEKSSDAILEKIASNTANTNTSISDLAAGFNALARAIENMGSSVMKAASSSASPTTVIANKPQDRPTIKSTQAAKNGNKEIFNFRQSIERTRQQPA